MHFPGPEKCIWLSLDGSRLLAICILRHPAKTRTLHFQMKRWFSFFLEMAAVSHFCREQRAKCIFQAWKNAFGHGSARSRLVLGVVKGCL